MSFLFLCFFNFDCQLICHEFIHIYFHSHEFYPTNDNDIFHSNQKEDYIFTKKKKSSSVSHRLCILGLDFHPECFIKNKIFEKFMQEINSKKKMYDLIMDML